MTTQIETIQFRAEVSAVDALDPSYSALMERAMDIASRSGMEKSDVSPIGTNMKPRMLNITAFIAHTEVANLNGTGFKQADIEAAVTAGMFKPPYMGMIDFNHDFTSYGAWYDASLVYDPKAKQYGILAKGAIFAWAYPELTDRMLAMQARNGFIDVSMACIAASYEEGSTADGSAVRWMRNPVFFTTSVLDVKPAFPNAQGTGSEDPAQSDGERENALMVRASHEEKPMDNEQTIETETETANVDATESTEVTETAADLPSDAPEVEAPVVDEKPVNDQADVAALKNEIETLRLALKAAEDSITTLAAEKAELEVFKASADNKLAEEIALRAATDKAARQTARLADLPESIRDEMLSPDKASLLESYVAMNDEQWEITKSLFEKAASASSRKSKVDVSLEEGKLTAIGEPQQGGRAIDVWLTRSK